MTPEQRDVMVESLVEEFNGVIKYFPMLCDQSTGQELEQERLDAIRANALATAKTFHAKAIADLSVELSRAEYALLSVEQIQEYLTTEHEIESNGVMFREQPPITRVWHGIPYCRNMPRIEDIIEARV